MAPLPNPPARPPDEPRLECDPEWIVEDAGGGVTGRGLRAAFQAAGRTAAGTRSRGLSGGGGVAR
ncbi:MAG: hypothetical protein ACK5X3_02035 [Pseudomonadota bacterium]